MAINVQQQHWYHELTALPLKERFQRVIQILDSDLSSVELDARDMHRILHQHVHTWIDSIQWNPSSVDVPMLVAAYHALRLVNPMAGSPLFQTEFDLFFTQIQQLHATLPKDTEEDRMLSAIEADYVQLLTAKLSERDDETFRRDSYYWLTLLSDGYTSPYILEVLAKDAEQRLFSNYDKVKTSHHAPGWHIPSIEVTWLLNAHIAMQLNPLHRYALETECADIAKENLMTLRDMDDAEGHNTQLLTLLYLRTGEPTCRQLAEAIIATWSQDELSPEQKYFLQYYHKVA